LYRGLDQSALDIINPESRNYARLTLPAGQNLDYSQIRTVSVSSDTRYISVAGKTGFAHLSTTSGRWRILEPFDGVTSDLNDALDHVPRVRGGMCWYGNILLVAASFAESNEVHLQKTCVETRSVYTIATLLTCDRRHGSTASTLGPL
jgi:hypothetical protein